jgi:hypothetical protein
MENYMIRNVRDVSKKKQHLDCVNFHQHNHFIRASVLSHSLLPYTNLNKQLFIIYCEMQRKTLAFGFKKSLRNKKTEM